MISAVNIKRVALCTRSPFFMQEPYLIYVTFSEDASSAGLDAGSKAGCGFKVAKIPRVALWDPHTSS